MYQLLIFSILTLATLFIVTKFNKKETMSSPKEENKKGKRTPEPAAVETIHWFSRCDQCPGINICGTPDIEDDIDNYIRGEDVSVVGCENIRNDKVLLNTSGGRFGFLKDT